jgi:hypothetical protein
MPVYASLRLLASRRRFLPRPVTFVTRFCVWMQRSMKRFAMRPEWIKSSEEGLRYVLAGAGAALVVGGVSEHRVFQRYSTGRS